MRISIKDDCYTATAAAGTTSAGTALACEWAPKDSTNMPYNPTTANGVCFPLPKSDTYFMKETCYRTEEQFCNSDLCEWKAGCPIKGAPLETCFGPVWNLDNCDWDCTKTTVDPARPLMNC